MWSHPPLTCHLLAWLDCLSYDNVPDQAIGEAFYTELGEAAPEMIHLFARPKTIQVKFCTLGTKFCPKYGVTCEIITLSYLPWFLKTISLDFSIFTLFSLYYWKHSLFLCLWAMPSQSNLFVVHLGNLIGMARDPAALFQVPIAYLSYARSWPKQRGVGDGDF